MNAIFYLSYDTETTFELHFGVKTAKILSYICNVVMAVIT